MIQGVQVPRGACTLFFGRFLDLDAVPYGAGHAACVRRGMTGQPPAAYWAGHGARAASRQAGTELMGGRLRAYFMAYAARKFPAR